MAPSARRPVLTLQGQLTLLVLSVLVPALAIATLLVWDASRAERRSLQRQMAETTRALSLVIERQIGQDQVLLETLSTSPYYQNHDWERFDAQARAALKGRDGWIVVTVGDTRRQVVNTRLAPGAALSFPSGPAPQIAWGVPRPGYGLSSIFTGRRELAPLIALRRRGEPYNIVLIRPAASFQGIWRDQGLPATWTGVVVDASRKVVARSRNYDRFLGQSASTNMQGLLQAAREGVTETRTLDGVKSLTAWSRSPATGWSFIVAVPTVEVAQAVRRSLLWGGLLALLLLVAGVSLAARMARRIAAPIEAMAAAAPDLTTGVRFQGTEGGAREIDQLGEALTRAARTLTAREGELKELNATLEARVGARTRELAEAAETLVQTQKLEAVGRLTGGIAHDFNNLLMAVLGNIELASRRPSDARQRAQLERAWQAADRGAKLTAQLLAFSRRQQLEPRPTDVRTAVRTAVGLVSTSLHAGVQIRTEVADGVWPAMADAAQLELVLLNLAINACDAMPSGGTIVVRAANVTVTQRGDRPEAPPPGEFVKLTVVDTGTGMTPEVAARVFEPFFTTKGVGAGSGLGLPQVLGYAKQLGGGVEVATAPGAGAAVAVYMPRAATEADGETGFAPEPLAAFDGLSVLVVDDDADVRAVSSAILTELGCAVRETPSGEAALDLFRAGYRPDMALIDYAMPGLNGEETARRLREADADLLVIMMTGYADVEALSATWAGVLLHKPFSASSLGGQIERTLRAAPHRARRAVASQGAE